MNKECKNVSIWICIYQYLLTHITLIEFFERHLTTSFKNTRAIFAVSFSLTISCIFAH